MNVRGRLAGLTLIIVVLSTLGYALAGQGVLWPLVGLVCIAANLLLHGIEGRDQFMLPRWIVVIAAVGVLAWGVTRAMGGFKIDALCECVLALMFLKLWDRKSPGDYAQILTLAVYLAIGCTVRGDFAPFMIVALCVPAILCATMLFQIYASQHRFTRHGARPSVVRWSNLSFALFFASGFALISMISALVFVFMPRGPMMEQVGLHSAISWAARLGGVGRISGFNNQVELGRGGLISESRAVVAEVSIQSTTDDKVPLDTLHLRGAVLESYDKGLWKARDSTSTREIDSEELKRGVPRPFAGRPHPNSAARSVDLHIVLRDADRTIPLFTPWWPTTIEFFASERLSLDKETLILKRNGPEGAFEYSVQSIVGSSIDPKESESRKPENRPKVSFPSAIVTKIAQDLLAKALIEPDPAKRPPSEDPRAARVIEGYLRREFKYTTDLLAAPSGHDPIEWFLTTSKQGHCEYFASAMVAMCRSVGIPARLVTGYVAAEHTAPRVFIVRQSNAHAWVEAAVDAFPPEGKDPDNTISPLRWHAWRTFDPTPPADFLRIHQPEPTMTLKFGKLLSSLEAAWSSNILRFDDRRQSSFLSTSTSSNWVETKLTRLSSYFGDGMVTTRERIVRMAIFLVVLGVCGFGFVLGSDYLWRRLRRRSKRVDDAKAASSLLPAIEQIRNSYQRALATRKLSRIPEETLMSHLERCGDALGRVDSTLPAEAARLVAFLYIGQFGNGLNEEQLREAGAACKRVERLLTSENSQVSR